MSRNQGWQEGQEEGLWEDQHETRILKKTLEMLQGKACKSIHIPPALKA